MRTTGRYRADRHPKVVATLTRDADAEAEERQRLSAARGRVVGQAGQAFFDRLVDGYAEWTAADVELLVAAANLANLIAECEVAIARDGLVLDGAKGGLVRHPSSITLGGARTELRQTLRALSLDRDT